MASVSQFAQYLLKLDPQRNPARLTLFNFIKHVIDPALPFSPAIIQQFYGRVLQFDHWQNEAQSLGETIRADVFGYLKQAPLENQAAAWARVRHSDTLQVVPVKLFQDLEELVENEFEPRRKSGDQIKLVKLSDHQILVAVLAPAGGLEVRVYPNLAMVWGATLKLMAPVTHLHYTPSFELMPHMRQILEGTLLTTHSFQVDADGVHGLVVRGHSLQKFETYIRAKMSETQDLFNSLKKIERHFIDPQSDPDYQEIVTKLERANRLLSNPTLDNVLAAEKALGRGRMYLKNAFPNDRLLGLLVTHLDYGLSQKRKTETHAGDTP